MGKHNVSVQLSDIDFERLNTMAKKEKLEKSKIIRRSLDAYLDRYLGVKKLDKNLL